MMSQAKPTLRAALRCGGAVMLALGGACQTPPPDVGSTGGRRDPYRTTASDRGSDKALMAALLEFSDRTAVALVSQLVDIEQVEQASGPLALELGDLRNLTNTPSTDFELIQHRIRNHLLHSKLMTKRFQFVESAARMDQELRRIDSLSPDRTRRYDAENTYVLIGDFFESNRGGLRRYYFEFKLVHLASRVTVFGEKFDLAQQ